MLVIILGVICISLGKPASKETAGTEKLDDTSYFMWLSILFAIGCAFCYAINALIMKHFIKEVGFTPIQLNLDGFFVCSIYMAFCFFTTSTVYTMQDILLVCFSSVLSLIGVTSLTIALTTGKAGPIYSIDSLKSLIPLFLNIIFDKNYPTSLQYLGIFLGIAGAVATANAK